MTRILLDECLPVKLKYRFEEGGEKFHISTVTSQGWIGINNGSLLEKAQQEYDIFVTIDQNLPYQQEISKYSIAIILLKANSNRYMDLLEFVEPALKAIKKAEINKIYEIILPGRGN